MLTPGLQRLAAGERRRLGGQPGLAGHERGGALDVNGLLDVAPEQLGERAAVEAVLGGAGLPVAVDVVADAVVLGAPRLQRRDPRRAGRCRAECGQAFEDLGAALAELASTSIGDPADLGEAFGHRRPLDAQLVA